MCSEDRSWGNTVFWGFLKSRHTGCEVFDKGESRTVVYERRWSEEVVFHWRVIVRTRNEKFPGVFVGRRVGVSDWATGDVRYVRLMYMWSICETVWRRGFVYKEDGDSSQDLTVESV